AGLHCSFRGLRRSMLFQLRRQETLWTQSLTLPLAPSGWRLRRPRRACGAASGGVWPDRAARGRAVGAKRGLDAGGGHGGGVVGSGGVSAQGGAAPPAPPPRYPPGDRLFPPGPRRGPPPAGQGIGAACRVELESAVAAAGPAGPGPAGADRELQLV